MTYPKDSIHRNPDDYAQNNYDLIVVGGGIYGIMLSLEAARRNLRCLLLERDDFGFHTSANHLRILHGGLRYLQSLDFKRFRESVSERSWFLSQFPELTSPIDCLMPLSGRGVYRPVVFNAALTIDTLAAWDKNHQIPGKNRLLRGYTCSADEVRRLVPDLSSDFIGGALWQDGFILDPLRLQIELLRWSCGYGTHALNYCSAEKLVVEKGAVTGVGALDHSCNKQYMFRAPLVVNAAGPWCRQLAAFWDRDIPEIFPHRILVWNLLIKRPALSTAAVALTVPQNKHTYFVVPWHGKMLAGTGHALLDPNTHRPPTEAELARMLDGINSVLGSENIALGDVQKVYWGVMPGSADCQLGKRPVIHDHGQKGGPSGFVTVSGVKFTTARKVAEQAMKRFFPNYQKRKKFKPLCEGGDRWKSLNTGIIDEWRNLFQEESIVSLADAILRRSDYLASLEWTEKSISDIASLFIEKQSHQQKEIQKTVTEMNSLFTSLRGNNEPAKWL